jgi:hypothetical protein
MQETAANVAHKSAASQQETGQQQAASPAQVSDNLPTAASDSGRAEGTPTQNLIDRIAYYVAPSDRAAPFLRCLLALLFRRCSAADLRLLASNLPVQYEAEAQIKRDLESLAKARDTHAPGVFGGNRSGWWDATK